IWDIFYLKSVVSVKLISMTRKERAKHIGEILDELYPELEVPLYHKDPYTLLIAVLLSAQATDKKVNEITPILFEKADNPWDMARLSVDEVREIIRPVGLSPQKSKAIVKLSQILVDEYEGMVPEDLEILKT